MAINTSTMKDFARALAKYWFSGMSGALSVPLAIATYFVDGTIAKIGLGATAFVCVWAAAYLVWKAEREKRFEAGNALQSFKNEIKATLLVTAEVDKNDTDNNYRQLYWRVTLENTNSRPLQFSDVKLSGSLNGGDALLHTGRGDIVMPNRSKSFTFPFSGEYVERSGEMLIDIKLQYGVPGAKPLRELKQLLRVMFQPRGAIVFSECSTRSYVESELD